MARSTKILEDSFQFTPIVFVRALYAGGKEGDSCLDVVLCSFAEE